MTSVVRQLPSVDRLLQIPTITNLSAEFGHVATVDAIRTVLDDTRRAVLAGASLPADDVLVQAVHAYFQKQRLCSLQPVINATGVIIHTNLGRAPLSQATVQAMATVAAGYSNLEFDLAAGERGGRGASVERLLTRFTGAEAALAVNNNASAVLLVLTALAAGRGVVISRGQLVEIGGGFRVPDVMRQSGARLIEVGTTNRTHLRDYRQALEEHDGVGALLRAHRSNFQLVGFVTEPTLSEIAALAHENNLILIDDLGSGALLDTTAYGLDHEPMAQESIIAGADIVCFSGDKLLGGPQAGIIIGRADLVQRVRRHPWARAVRMDKVALAGLEATLAHYAKGEAAEQVPVWKMISRPVAEIKRQAQRWERRLRTLGLVAKVMEGRSTIGGGSLPGTTLPTWWVALTVPSPDALGNRLRQGEPPVITRIEDDRLLLDPRTVLAGQEKHLLTAIQKAFEASHDPNPGN
jgi:L-seryl-tRNA(Ser) seleniumtransferase